MYSLGLIRREDSTAGQYQSYHSDIRGSTTFLTDEQGKISDRYSCGYYGEVLAHEGSTHQPFQYNGRDGVMHDANGLYYMRARYYHPELKRFLNRDVLKGYILEGQTLNGYAYVNGDPVSYVDPLGLEKQMVKSTSVGSGEVPGKWKIHFTQAEGFSKSNGVKGAHTQEAFNNYFSDKGLSYKEVSKTSVIDGIDDISYQVQSTYGAGKNAGQGIPGKYNTTIYQKTLVDTSRISVETINEWASEAIKNGSKSIRHGNNLYFQGTAANGLKFEGWVNSSGGFDSLYPVLKWSN